MTSRFFTYITKKWTFKNMPYYAVAKGRKPGIYHTWNECRNQVQHFPGSIFKKFSSILEAENFIKCQTAGSPSMQILSRKRKTRISSSTETLTKTPKRAALESSNLHNLGEKQKSNEDNDCVSYIKDDDGFINVYTDGACSMNGQKDKEIKAGIGVWFGENHPLNVSRSVTGRATNNSAEIEAVTEAARQATKAGITKLRINTDSKFLISCVTQWMPRWKANGWQTSNNQPVINKKELIEMEKATVPLEIEWKHVNGHSGIHGNEMADKLARKGCIYSKLYKD